MTILVRAAVQQLLKSAVALTASSAKSNFIFLISAIISKIRVTMKSATVALVGAALTRMQLALAIPAPVVQGGDVDEEEPNQSPPIESVNEVAMPVAKTSRKGAALYDGGCTTLMTNSKNGLIGDLYDVQSATFNTAGGTQQYNTMGLYMRTIHGAKGGSFQFKQAWYYSPSLPFDVIGAHALRKAYGVKYFDSDPPTAPDPYVVFTQQDGLKLELVRGSNGLEWLPYSPSPSVRQQEECMLIVPYVWSEYEAKQLRHVCARHRP